MKPFLLIKTPERQFKFKIVENMGIFKEIIYNDNHIVAYRSASGKKRIYLKNSPSVEEWKEIAKNILINMLGYVPHARVTVRCMKKKLSFEVGHQNKKLGVLCFLCEFPEDAAFGLFGVSAVPREASDYLLHVFRCVPEAFQGGFDEPAGVGGHFLSPLGLLASAPSLSRLLYLADGFGGYPTVSDLDDSRNLLTGPAYVYGLLEA